VCDKSTVTAPDANLQARQGKLRPCICIPINHSSHLPHSPLQSKHFNSHIQQKIPTDNSQNTWPGQPLWCPDCQEHAECGVFWPVTPKWWSSEEKFDTINPQGTAQKCRTTCSHPPSLQSSTVQSCESLRLKWCTLNTHLNRGGEREEKPHTMGIASQNEPQLLHSETAVESDTKSCHHTKKLKPTHHTLEHVGWFWQLTPALSDTLQSACCSLVAGLLSCFVNENHKLRRNWN